MEASKTAWRIGVGLVCLALFFLGFLFGVASVPESVRVTDVSNMDAGKPERVDFEDFWEAWNVINERFVATGDAGVSSQEKVWGAIGGLTDSLGDPYSVFMPPEELTSFTELISGEFGGVGMEVGEKDGFIVVIAPLKGTPAERAGIKPGDYVIEINATSTVGFSVDEAVQLIRGEPGTKVTLTIARDGVEEPMTVEITRERIAVPTLDARVEGNAFVVSLYNFDALSTGDFRKAMREFAASGVHDLVIDVRGNPGGFLDAAVDIASYFLPEGAVVVRERFDDIPEHETVHRSKGYGLVAQTVDDIIVVVDAGSASASEILAGALRDNGVARIVGETTFGKGSVQELIPIDDGAALKLTIAQWFTPNDISISNGGLTPDIEVLFPEEAPEGSDPQLEKALELLAEA